jgi:hypothetical protein
MRPPDAEVAIASEMHAFRKRSGFIPNMPYGEIAAETKKPGLGVLSAGLLKQNENLNQTT